METVTREISMKQQNSGTKAKETAFDDIKDWYFTEHESTLGSDQSNLPSAEADSVEPLQKTASMIGKPFF